jgi:hypothetical protein
MAAILPAPFHGDTPHLVEHEVDPFTPAKPICKAIGPEWSGQFKKMNREASRSVDGISAARRQLESASGFLAGLEFARDKQARLDLLTAANTQCQAAALFICNFFDEVNHA